MPTYIIEPVEGEPYEVEAELVWYEDISHNHALFLAEDSRYPGFAKCVKTATLYKSIRLKKEPE